MLPQHRHPGLCRIAEARLFAPFAAAIPGSAALAIIGRQRVSLGDSALQYWHSTGRSHSAIGRKSEKGPQRGQRYSYLGM